MSNFSPPPTYAEVVLTDKDGKHPRFNPIWLKWFVDLTANVTAGGAGSGTVTSITTGNGLSGGPITATGTISLTHITDSATTTALALSGGGSNYITLANSNTDPTIGTSAGIIKNTVGMQVTGITTPNAGAGVEVVYDATITNIYTTWDTANKGANIVLTGGNLSITKNASNWQSTRSVISKASGKFYWEVTVNASAGANGLFIGIGTSFMGLGNFVGADANGWGWQGGGTAKRYNNGVGVAYGANYTTSDVIGVALDLTGGTLTFYLNNATQGVAYSGLSGTFFATASCYTNAGDGLTANFGATAFTYTPPAGFVGLYSAGAPVGGAVTSYDRTASAFRNMAVIGDTLYLACVTGIKWGAPLVNAGGGAGATLNTIGGSGPATALQNSWMPVIDNLGTQYWFPVWR